MTNDQLTLKIRAAKNSANGLVAELLVDGRHLAPDAVVDIRELVKSVQTSGKHWFFTCECGVPMCAGINNSIVVRHTFDAVEWHFKRLDSLGDHLDLSDEQYGQENIAELFQFDPEEYRMAVELGLRDARAGLVSSTASCLPYIDYKAQDIQSLSTKIFSERDCFQNRRILAREIMLHATDGIWITADGIPFSIEQLSLESDLLQQFLNFKSLECFPRAATDLVAFENFLHAGRQFGRELKRGLDEGSKVKLWYRYGPVGNPDVWSVTEELR